MKVDRSLQKVPQTDGALTGRVRLWFSVRDRVRVRVGELTNVDRMSVDAQKVDGSSHRRSEFSRLDLGLQLGFGKGLRLGLMLILGLGLGLNQRLGLGLELGLES